MKKFGKVLKSIFALALLLGMANMSYAQCGKFNDSPEGGSALKAHSVYRTYMSGITNPEDLSKLKEEDFKIAFDNWKAAYGTAPAADGKRPAHWRDGRKFYTYMLMNETDDAKKEEYFDTILRLYDEEQACYKTKGLPSYALGRKAFDMFYGLGAEDAKLRGTYDAMTEVLAEAIKVGGNATEYIVLDPYARVVVYQFTNEKMDKETARAIHGKLNEIADYNIANNAQLKAQFEFAKDRMNKVFAQIERNIFDCDYFINKIQPDFPGNEDNPEFLKNSITILKQQGCDAASSPFLADLESRWKKYADEENRKRQEEFERNNPDVMAKKLRDAGDYKGALAKYQEAIDKEEDAEKQGLYYYRIAEIKGKKLRDFNGGISNANKALKLRSSWGLPHILIGDLYIQKSKSCGDAFLQKCAYLAAVDKYRYAKSLDPSVAEKANDKIGKFAGTRPDKDTAFMRGGLKEGDTVQVSCIGTSVKLRF